MSSLNKVKGGKPAKKRIYTATSFALEQMESRILMSTTVAAWNFDQLTIQTTPPAISPAASSGVGTAYTVGMQTSTGSVSPYTYPNPNASGTGDASDILNGTGNNTSADHSSTGSTGSGDVTGSNPAWRIRGCSDGWSSNALPGTQGAEFDASTSGDSGISVSFDLDPSSASAPSQIAVQYTTDGTNWTTVPAADLGTPTSATGATTDVTVATGAGGNLVTGGYYQIANSTTTPDALFWQNGFTVNLTGISGVNNNPHFGVRIVNGASGASETNVGGSAYTAAGGGNWRLDNVLISASGGTLTAPSVTTNPTNQSVPAGQPVTFTAAATGNPTPTVQWFVGPVGSGTAITGATNSTLTFTTSSTATDNGNTYYAVFTNSTSPFTATTTGATLTDTLTAPTITNPTNVSIPAGNTATFSVTTSGSPLPTVQWYEGAVGSGTALTNGVQGDGSTVTGATSTTLTLSSVPLSDNNNTYYAVATNGNSTTPSVSSTAATLAVTGTTIAAWNFNTDTAGANTSPAVSSGSGTASSVGMTSDTATNPGPYPVSHTVTSESTIGQGPDGSTVETTSGGSEDGTTGNEWKIVGTKSGSNGNGWNLNAPIGSQGAQFLVSTVGYTNVNLSFDWGISSTAANGQLAVEYTTNSGTTWTVAPTIALGSNTNASGHGDTEVLSNSSNGNIIAGSYFEDQNNTNGGAGLYQNGLNANFTGVAGVANNSGFGVRLVNAATGTAVVNASGGGTPSQTSANWRFDDIQITGTNIPTAPAVTTQPLNQSVSAGSAATFTAAASGFPTPTVQWQVSTNGGTTFTNDTTDSGNTTGTLTVASTTLSESGYEYRAVFTNNVAPNTATSNAATLTVMAAPVVTTSPMNMTVAAGSTVTLTAAATGSPTPTVQWNVSTNGGSTWVALTNGSALTNLDVNNVTGATTTTLTFTAEEGVSGDQFQAVFTNVAGTANTVSDTVTVIGTPIAQWIWPTTFGQQAPGGTTVVAGTGNEPTPTFNLPVATAVTSGLYNDYTGTQAFPESDIISFRSAVNASFNEDIWRLRAGNGTGPTGSPGTPEGWSQNAPNFDNTLNGTSITTSFGASEPVQPQGAVFSVNTLGYSNITMHFDWQQGGISDMQPEYSTDGGTTWIPDGGIIAQTGSDFYGITPTTTPTGITLSFPGVSNAANFEVRLVAAYNPALPLILDGNTTIDSPSQYPLGHGQFSTGLAGNVNAQQNFEFESTINSGDSVPLTYGSSTTSFTYSSDPATLIANVTTALTSLVGSGNFSVALSNYKSLPENIGSEISPNRDANGIIGSDLTVTFTGSLSHTNVNTITTTNTNVKIATWVTGSTSGYAPYVDGGGAWEFGNISFNADVIPSTVSGHSNYALSVTANPAATTVPGGGNATFTSTVYAENTSATSPTVPSVTWQVSTDNGGTWNTATGTASPLTFTNSVHNSYSSTFTYTSHVNLSDSGYLFRAVFTDDVGTSTSGPAQLTVVPPSAPTITLQPVSQAIIPGDYVTFTAGAVGAPVPSVQWELSTNGGTSYAPISGATNSTYTLTAVPLADSGYVYEAVFTNAVSSATTAPATLTVLGPETNITNWDFNNSQYNSYASPTSAATLAQANSPAPSGGVVGTGVAEEVGMNLPYNAADSASGTDGNGAVADGDIPSSTSAQQPTFIENTWRIRGGVPSTVYPLTGGTPANGWSNLVPQYSQGAQINVPTSGYQNVYVTMDWYSTKSAEMDAQEQYTTGGTTVVVSAASSSNNTGPAQGLPLSSGQNTTNNIATLTAPNDFKFGDEVTVTGLPAPYTGTFQVVYATPTSFSYYTPTAGSAWSGTGSGYVPTWTNLGNLIQNNTFVAGNDEFYQATATAAPQPVVFNLTGIPGVDNNPNFGIRLVNAYDPTLSNTQYLTVSDPANFFLTFGGTANGTTTPQTTSQINYSTNTTTEAAAIQSALAALPNVGVGNVSVAYNSTKGAYGITFNNLLNVAAQPPVVVSDSLDSVATNYQYANAQSALPSVVPYNGSKGNWRFDNIEVHGNTIVAPTQPAWLAAPNANATWNSATKTLTVTGPVTIISDPGTDEPKIVANGSAAQITIAPVTDTDVHVGGITLTNGAGITMQSVGGVRSHSVHNTLVVGTLGATADPTFSIDASSKLDLTDNDLVVHTGSNDTTGQTELGVVQGQAAAGRNVAPGGIFDGTWTGNGLTSSAAANADSSANAGYEQNILAVALNSDLFLGGPSGNNSVWTVGSASETLGANDILVKYTYNGDLNLEGAVNGDASTVFSSYYPIASGANDFAFGDLNGDGKVDGNDSTIFSSVYGNGLSGSGLPLL
jgi:hypothetical protein